MDKIKIKINIAGSEFNILSQDSEEYTTMIAGEVNKKINDIQKSNSRVSITAAAMLAALNFCDNSKKAEKDIENLKQQIKEYLSEIAENREETEELKKENQRLKKDIQIYRQRLSEESTVKNSDYAPVSTAVKAVKKSVSVSDIEEAAEDDTKFFDIKNTEL